MSLTPEERLDRLERRDRVVVLGCVALIFAIVASVVGGVSVVIATQSTLLTAFQTGVTLHEAKP